MEQIKQSGETTPIEVVKPTMNGHINEEGVLFAAVESILDSQYEDDMDWYSFEVMSYSGDIITLKLKEKHIHEINLFFRKEKAGQAYYKHLTKNN